MWCARKVEFSIVLQWERLLKLRKKKVTVMDTANKEVNDAMAMPPSPEEPGSMKSRNHK